MVLNQDIAEFKTMNAAGFFLSFLSGLRILFKKGVVFFVFCDNPALVLQIWQFRNYLISGFMYGKVWLFSLVWNTS